MQLVKLYSKFSRRCRSYDKRIININAKRSIIPQWEFNYLTEVLISDIWQSWCHFCRQLFLSSCRGTKARDGSLIPSRAGDNSRHRLGYEARQGVQRQNAKANGHLNFAIRNEPTWGDLDVFIKICNAVRPNNYNTLITSFGSFSSLKHLQNVRNACAHKNIETMTELLSMSAIYRFSNLNCATDFAWTRKTSSSEFAIELWLYEMKTIADLSTAQA